MRLIFVRICRVSGMGNRRSRPIVYPPLDPMFIPIGCTGMLRKEYDKPRLDLAPFLYYRIRVTSYSQLIARILELMRTLPPMDETTPPPPARPEDLDVPIKRIHGPVYIFIAFDPETGIIEAYLYFPSMTKNREKWTSYHFLGIAHSWMYRIMYSPDYNILLPNTNCGRRIRDPRHTIDFEKARVSKQEELRQWKELLGTGGKPTPGYVVTGMPPFYPMYTYNYTVPKLPPLPESELPRAPAMIASLQREIAAMDDVVKSMGMMIGCRTESSYSCVQSKRAHKMMRIYRRRQPIYNYPAAYFRVYSLNLDDPRFAPYVEDNSIKTLYRNILPSDVDMFAGCRYMMVSPNKKYFMVLSSYWLTVFWNYGDENLELLCRFNRSPSSAMAVRMIPVYGQANTRLIIEDGSINIYSEIFENEQMVYSRKITSESSRPPFALVLQDDGSLVLYDSQNIAVSSADGFMSEAGSGMIDDYDAAADYRQRIINLIAYLRLYNLYKEIEANQATLPSNVAMYVLQEGIPTYNADIDYRERLEKLVKYLIDQGFKNLVQQAVVTQQEIASASAAPSTSSPAAPSTSSPTAPSTSSPSAPAPAEPEYDEYGLVKPPATQWQQPSSTVDPNQEADQEVCAGLADEALANCLDTQENEVLAQELATETAAQTSEYQLIDSEDPMTAAVAPGTIAQAGTTSTTTEVVPFTSEEYQAAIAVCRSYTTGESYTSDQDLYCRLVALKEYLRKSGYNVIDPNAASTTTMAGTSSNIYVTPSTEYNQPVDFATRLQATRSLFPTTQQL